jgi:putative ABC transport system substrate-binding protein
VVAGAVRHEKAGRSLRRKAEGESEQRGGKAFLSAQGGAIGLQIQILNASTKDEIEAAFVTLVRDQIDALFVIPDPLFISQRDQFATLTARYRIPATFSTREEVEAGGLMSYGSDFQAMWRQLGIYTGQILKGAKPADLPVMQSTKFELVINLKTAKTLGLTIPPGVLSIADEVIE